MKDPNARQGQEGRTVCVDIDGVLAVPRADLDYGRCEPVHGAVAALRSLRAKGLIVVLFTGRHFNRLSETKEWLEREGFEYDHLVMGKPTARYYIDDRAVAFKGDWAAVERELAAPDGSGG